MAETETFKQRLALASHWLGFGIAIIMFILGIALIFETWDNNLEILFLSPVPLFIGWVIRWLIVGGKVPYLPYQD